MEKNTTDCTIHINSVKQNNLKAAANELVNRSKLTTQDIIKKKAKFQITSEPPEKLNLDDNINTDETSTEENQLIEISSPSNANVHEFSVNTLNRKLKAIRNYKKNAYKKNTRPSVSDTIQTSSSHRISVANQELMTSRMDGVQIMMNPTKLINEHLAEIQLRIIGHSRAAIMFDKRDKIIGYPVTILSSFLSSSIMMSITSTNKKSEDVIKYISLSLALVSFLFSVSRDFLQFSRKFQSHDLSSKLYTTLLRSMEVRLINNHLNKEEKRDIFKDIVDQMSIIEQYETPIPAYIDIKVRNESLSLSKDISQLN